MTTLLCADIKEEESGAVEEEPILMKELKMAVQVSCQWIECSIVSFTGTDLFHIIKLRSFLIGLWQLGTLEAQFFSASSNVCSSKIFMYASSI